MRVLVVGSGGREAAIAWACTRHGHTARIAADLPTPIDADLVIVGPEAALVAGVADRCMDAGVPCFGPSAGLAKLEGSKGFTRTLAQQLSLPSPRFHLSSSVEDALGWCAGFGGPVVVKLDGLAAGKGVIVPEGQAATEAAIRELLEQGPIVLEERLTGPECSLMAICDGTVARPLPIAQDHKRIGEGDTGPNTGGMGAYCPADAGDASFTWRLDGTLPTGVQQVLDLIVHPTLRALRERDMPFRGLLYCGVMLTPTGPRVVEFNCRFGDPETQAVLPALADDARILPVMLQIARGERIDPVPVFAPAHAVVTTVIAAAGYPAMPQQGDLITLPAVPADAWLFHAGTTQRSGELATSGGRVLTATARGTSLADAQRRSTALAAGVRFDGAFFRRDIGWRALARGA